jgi:hypothetical protein
MATVPDGAPAGGGIGVPGNLVCRVAHQHGLYPWTLRDAAVTSVFGKLRQTARQSFGLGRGEARHRVAALLK